MSTCSCVASASCSFGISGIKQERTVGGDGEVHITVSTVNIESVSSHVEVGAPMPELLRRAPPPSRLEIAKV
jgi:hypothetical protein